LDRYLGSNLNGCLAPVVRSSVISSVGPVLSSFGTGIGWSEEGPIAVENARTIGVEGEAGCDREVGFVVDVWTGTAGSGRLFSFDKLEVGGSAFADCEEVRWVVVAGDVDGLEERLLISTGVEDTGGCVSGLLAFVMSWGIIVGSAGGADEGLTVAMVDAVQGTKINGCGHDNTLGCRRA